MISIVSYGAGNIHSIAANVTLQDDVLCGPNMVFTIVYNPRSAVSRKDECRRNTLVKRSASLGANATILGGTTIGKYAFIAAGAVVNRNVKPYALMAGLPAKQIGWASHFGETLDLPLSGEGTATCAATGLQYWLQNGALTVLADYSCK